MKPHLRNALGNKRSCSYRTPYPVSRIPYPVSRIPYPVFLVCKDFFFLSMGDYVFLFLLLVSTLCFILLVYFLHFFLIAVGTNRGCEKTLLSFLHRKRQKKSYIEKDRKRAFFLHKKRQRKGFLST